MGELGKWKMAQQNEEGQVNINSMPVEQLQNLKKQLDGECENFQTTITSLKFAQSKYEESQEALVAVTGENEGKQMLVPLTNSLYCSGTLGDTKKVMVDIGTGYIVEKTPEKAADFFGRKKEFCASNISKVQQLLATKRKNLESVTIVLQQKQAAATGAVGGGVA